MAVNLHDYSRTAAQRGWGAGWPSCAGVKNAGTAIITADRSGARLSVHKRIARLADMIIDEIERRGYVFTPGKCGGYNCRRISGTQSASNHSWGLALDMDWDRNPYKTPVRTTFPNWLIALFNRYGFAWGGLYGDAMHFEFMGTPADADAMTALAIRELTGATGSPAVPVVKPSPAPRPTTPAPSTPLGDDVMTAFDWPAGFGAHKLICPVGKASALVDRAWFSLACDGEMKSYDIWIQGDGGGLVEFHGSLAKDQRKWVELPDGATQMTVHYQASGPVGAALEIKAK